MKRTTNSRLGPSNKAAGALTAANKAKHAQTIAASEAKSHALTNRVLGRRARG